MPRAWTVKLETVNRLMRLTGFRFCVAHEADGSHRVGVAFYGWGSR